MKSIDAAFVVLHEAGRPLHYREITSQIIERNLWETQGKTLWDTVAARLGDDIRRFGEESRFVRSGSGMFGLNPMVATEQRNINRFLVQVNKDGGFDLPPVVVPPSMLAPPVPG
ncbi:MAG: hypothetical protein F4X66_00030, partial [Chloroflexi bacterium]|nr:hypothetical protein [Chloroflexota bacterium]MYE42050.1 hypothetical protein [Chloroflexota bacterium]